MADDGVDDVGDVRPFAHMGPDRPEGGGGSGVAGDEDGFAAALEEYVGDLEGTGAYGGRGLVAVGQVGGVAEVDHVLAGKKAFYGPCNGKPAYPAVKYPYGRVLVQCLWF